LDLLPRSSNFSISFIMLILGSDHLLGTRLVTNRPPEYGSSRVFATWELSDWVQLANQADTFSEDFLTFISRSLSNRVQRFRWKCPTSLFHNNLAGTSPLIFSLAVMVSKVDYVGPISGSTDTSRNSDTDFPIEQVLFKPWTRPSSRGQDLFTLRARDPESAIVRARPHRIQDLGPSEITFIRPTPSKESYLHS